MVEKYKLKWRENYHAELPPPTGPLEKEGFTLIEEPVDENEVDENKVHEDESDQNVPLSGQLIDHEDQQSPGSEGSGRTENIHSSPRLISPGIAVNSSPRNAAPAHNSCIDSPAPSVGDQSIGSPDDLSPGTRKVRRLA